MLTEKVVISAIYWQKIRYIAWQPY